MAYKNISDIVAIIVALLSLFFSSRMVRELAAEECCVPEDMGTGDQSRWCQKILMWDWCSPTCRAIPQSFDTVRQKQRDCWIAQYQPPKENVEPFLHNKIEKFTEVLPAHRVLPEMNDPLAAMIHIHLSSCRFHSYLQLFVISLLILMAFLTLNRSQRAKQNRVWVGLSKETAHQLGTPISSLIRATWVPREPSKTLITNFLHGEIDKDVDRLQMIAERFSKIGSDRSQACSASGGSTVISYMEKRVSDKVIFNDSFPNNQLP